MEITPEMPFEGAGGAAAGLERRESSMVLWDRSCAARLGGREERRESSDDAAGLELRDAAWRGRGAAVGMNDMAMRKETRQRRRPRKEAGAASGYKKDVRKKERKVVKSEGSGKKKKQKERGKEKKCEKLIFNLQFIFISYYNIIMKGTIGYLSSIPKNKHEELFCQTFFKTTSILLKKPLHWRSRSWIHFQRSRNLTKQTLNVGAFGRAFEVVLPPAHAQIIPNAQNKTSFATKVTTSLLGK